jgi:purine-binding chemotaxis protein CheW
MEASEDLRETAQTLTFRVRDQQYAIPILQVKEIIPFTAVTRLPRTPRAVLGLINLRGGAVPVVSLAQAFGLDDLPADRRSCVIVVEVRIDGETTAMGILADAVNDVIALRPDEIEAPPRLGAAVPEKVLQGMARVGTEFVPILDVQELLASPEFLFETDVERDGSTEGTA